MKVDYNNVMKTIRQGEILNVVHTKNSQRTPHTSSLPGELWDVLCELFGEKSSWDIESALH